MFRATGLPGWMRFGGGGLAFGGANYGASVAAPTPEGERNFLKDRAEVLQTQLDEIKKRLEELEAQETGK
jgi:hypothetical protein